MSSLRRRAICVQRAMSIARSSTGGRASARTTAPASLGVDEQPQPGEQVAHLGALEERRRAREPVRHRALLERDRDRLALVADRAHEHADVLRRDVLARDQPLDLGRHGLRLARARCRTARTRPPAGARPCSSFAIRSGAGSATARAAAMIRSGQRWLSSSRTTVVAGHSASKSRRFLAAAPRRRWIAWSSSPAALIWPCSPASSRSSRHWAKFASCSSSTSTWRKPLGHPRAHAGLRPQQAERVEHEVAEVARAGLLQPAVVGGVDGGELALAVGLRARASPPTRA